MGKILNVKKILLGSIAKYEGKYVQYVLTVRMIDIETGSVEKAESIDIASDDDMRRACRQIAVNVTGSINLVGEVALMEENYIYTDLGSDVGLQEGGYLEVFDVYLIKDKQGKILMREETVVAYLEIVEVDEQGSKCTVARKQQDIKEGMNLRPSSTIPEIEPVEKTSISFTSIPQGSKVYIDGEFIGISPVVLDDFKPGNYIVEMRYPGHRSYKGKIHLTEGRQITIERELERIVEVEDMAEGGKVLRKPTDPKQALAMSFLPGAGQFYNKYEKTGTGTMLSTFIGIGGALAFTYTFLDDSDEKDEGDYDDFYSYVLDYKITGSLLKTGILGGYTLAAYIVSILDSKFSASSPVKYSEYTELKFGAVGLLMQSSQDPNLFSGYENPELDEQTDSMSGISGGGFVSAGVRSRYMDTFLEFCIIPETASILSLIGHLKYPVLDTLSLTGGCTFLINMEETNGVKYSEEDPDAHLREITAVTLGIQFEKFPFLLVLDYSPLSLGVADMVYTYAPANLFIDTLYLQCLLGMYIRGRVDYFFNPRFGVSLDARYMWFDHMIDSKAQDAGLPVFEYHNTLFLSISPVFRF
jgi:hypothetical protein